MKYTFNTKLPSPAIVPLSTFAALSSYTYPTLSWAGFLSFSVTCANVSVVPVLSSVKSATFL